jgi:hypothetical protein
MQRIILILFIVVSTLSCVAKAKFCVATDEENRFLCTDDAAKANFYRNKNPSGNFNFDDLGVEQTVSGSEEEVALVTAVIDKMKEYFLHEVFAKPEYAPVRGKW